MKVDSFKYLPRIIAYYYQRTEREPDLPIPWTALSKPVEACKFGLVTSGGLYHRGSQIPFNLERERREKTWGDPSYREIPFDIHQNEIGVSHLHINPADILIDMNILLPVDRFKTLAVEGEIGALAERAYSFMGFQGFPPDTTPWENEYGPQVSARLLAEKVDCVLLTPA